MKTGSRFTFFASRWASSRALDWALIFALFVAAFAFYGRTMAPGLMEGDEGEFQINMYRLGVSHTGYPLFFMLGKLWLGLVPVGTMATRANLFSVFWGALAIAAMYGAIQFLTRNRWAAVIAALLLLGSRVEWSQAVIPRPYTLNSLFVILVILCFFLWRIGKVDLTVPVFVLGLSLTNHRTMMWFGPAIVVLVLAADYQAVFAGERPRGNLWAMARQWLTQSSLLKPRRIVLLVVAFVLPLLLYGYVFWRGESDVGVEFHWKDFNAEIMGGYVSASWRFGPLDWLISRVTELYLPLQIEQFSILGFGAGLIGMLALVLNRPPRGWARSLPAREAFWFILLASLANTAFCVIFWVIDIDKFFLPSFIPFLFFTGVGIAVMWDWLAAWRVRRLAHAGLVIVFAGAVVFLARSNYAGNDFSTRTDAITIWEDNLAQPLEKNALIVGSWESLTPLEYAMYVDGKRTDLERWKVIVKKYQLGQVPYDSRQAEIEREVRAGRPVYLTQHPSETETLGALADEFRLTRVGELWRLLNLPPQAAAPTGTPLATFTDREGRAIELVGYTLTPTGTRRAGDFVLATLFWRAPLAPGARFTISLRLDDATGQKIVQRDMEPASGLHPTVGWVSGEMVQDDAGFFIPHDAPPGGYRLAIVVYNSATAENLTTPAGEMLSFGEIQIAP